MVRSLEASDAKFDPETKRWTAPRYTKREFAADGRKHFEQFRNLDTLINLEVAELGAINDLIQTMNITELNQFLEQQRAKGSDSINIIEVEKHARYAYPLSTFILTLIGVSLSAQGPRRNRTPYRYRNRTLLLLHPFQPLLRGVRQERNAPHGNRRVAPQYHLPRHRRLPLPEGAEITCLYGENRRIPFPASGSIRCCGTSLLIAAIILAMAVVAHLVMQFGTRHGARRTVPDLSGRSARPSSTHRPQARPATAHQRLALRAGLRGGVVLDQLPEGGVEVKPGRTVYLTIKPSARRRCPCPMSPGRSLRQAKNMLEIAGLEIAELVYRPDLATNYVLEEYCAGNPSSRTPGSRPKWDRASRSTSASRRDTPRRSSRRWSGSRSLRQKAASGSSGLNIGRIDFDEGINLLNQKDARVYIQSPGPSTAAALGSRVDLRLTLDDDKLAEPPQAEAEKQAAGRRGPKPEARSRGGRKRFAGPHLARRGPGRTRPRSPGPSHERRQRRIFRLMSAEHHIDTPRWRRLPGGSGGNAGCRIGG